MVIIPIATNELAFNLVDSGLDVAPVIAGAVVGAGAGVVAAPVIEGTETDGCGALCVGVGALGAGLTLLGVVEGFEEVPLTRLFKDLL